MKWLDVVVVGGGLSGLACAALLANSGKNTLLLEATSRVGGQLADPKTSNLFIKKSLLTQLCIKHNLLQQRTNNQLRQLADFIEIRGGEIVRETPVKKVSYHSKDKIWTLFTPWGSIQSAKVALMLPKSKSFELLRPTYGREAWFETYFETSSKAIALQETKLPGLFIGDSFTFSDAPFIKNTLVLSQEIATNILRT